MDRFHESQETQETPLSIQLKTAARNLLCIGALAAASVPAFAQSREFQRGYDQGYRDGIESTKNPAPDAEDRRPGRIRVDRAEYGFRTEQCDATDAVRQSATGRRSLEVLANNQLCGDSAPNRPKTLTVSYRCGWDGAVRRASVREGTAMRLACR